MYLSRTHYKSLEKKEKTPSAWSREWEECEWKDAKYMKSNKADTARITSESAAPAKMPANTFCISFICDQSIVIQRKYRS